MSAPAKTNQHRDLIVDQVRHIEELAASDVSQVEFFDRFIVSVVAALGASAGAVWLKDSLAQGRPVAEARLASLNLQENPKAQRINMRLISELLSTGEACLYGPEGEAPLPSEHVVLLAALHDGQGCVGALEVFQRPDAAREARPGFLQFVEQMAGLASRYLQRRHDRPQSSEAEFREQLERFSLRLQQSLELEHVAATAANDGRLILDCDRVSVALKHGPKTAKVAAVSGQESVHARANLVRALAAVAAETMRYAEPVTYTGSAPDLPARLEEPLAEFLQESHSRMVMFLPLFAPEPLRDRIDDDEQKRGSARPRSPIGCLVIEQFSQSQPQPSLAERAELLAEHVEAALHNARSHEDLFLLPLWRFLGRQKAWFRGRRLAKTTAVLAAVMVMFAALVFIPWEYRVEGEGRLMPTVQRKVFAPWDGEVVDIFVQGGDWVEAGTPLLQLRNDELHAKLVSTRNELDEKRKELLGFDAALDQAAGNADRQEETRLQGKIAQTRIEIEGLGEQARILERREAALTVRAPISGIVAAFQLDQLLANRPVQRGESLLDVMDGSGEWRLELHVPEQRMGHLLQARQSLQNPQLPVEFLLATAPEATFHGRLERLATRSQLSEEGGNVVEAFVTLDDEVPDRRIGAEVQAKIACGRRSLGYVLFGDVIEFVRRRLWL